MESINKSMELVKSKIAQCDEYIKANPPPEKRQKLEEVRDILQTQLTRLSVAADIVRGAAFVIHTVDGKLTVAKPSQKAAALIKKAEEMGAQVTTYNKEPQLPGYRDEPSKTKSS
jgi:translation initiation factor 6 (eIF-6)